MSKTLLIYRRGGLGDTLLTFPLAEIYTKLGWKVHFVGNTDILPIAQEVGFIERFFSEIPSIEPYERVILIAAQNFIKSSKITWLYPFPLKREHITKYYLKSLKLNNIQYSEEIPLPKNNLWQERIIIHPGSGSPKKNASLDLYKSLYSLLKEKHFHPLFVLGIAEYPLIKDLKDFEVYFVDNLVKFAKLLKGAKGFIGNDSGFSHLAGYLGIPTVVLFGPSDPYIWRPIGKKVEILYKNLVCSPCFPADCRVFPLKQCLSFFEQEIISALERAIRL